MVRVAAAYLVGAWFLIQVADTIFPYLGFVDQAVTWVIYALGIGFLPAILFAWLFEFTPQGLKKETEFHRDEAAIRHSNRQLDIAIMTLLLAGITYFAVDKFVLDPRRDQELIREAVSSALESADQFTAESTKASIAVLPFLNLSADPEQEYFSDGLAEELLNLLAGIPELRVAARTSSFAFKDERLDVTTIAERLNVAFVLEGSVRKSGNKIRITAQLVRGKDGYQLWSENFDGTLHDVFATQDRIAASVVDSLHLKLLGERPRAHVVNPKAYALFLQGRYFNDRRDQENWQKASEAFLEALEFDPEYAEAWSGLSITYSQQASWGFIDRDDGFAKAREAVKRALTLDPNLASAHASLGWIRMVYDFDWIGADDAYQQAFALAPGNATVLRATAVLAFTGGRLEESIDINLRAIARDPLNQGGHQNLALVLMHAGRLDESEQAYLHVLDLNDEYPGIYMRLGQINLLRGEPHTALELIPLDSDPWWADYGLALALSATDRSEEANRALQRFIEDHPDGPFQTAEVYAYREEIDRAFEWLEQAYEQRDSGLHEMLNDPFLENLHDDPRWVPFLRRMGLSAGN